MQQTAVIDADDGSGRRAYVEPESLNIAADPVMAYMPMEQLEKNAALLESRMKKAAKDLDFTAAAQLRDELFALRKLIDGKAQVN